MTFYMSIIIITELLMFAMTVHVVNYSGFNKRQKRWFLTTFFAVMACAAAEFLVHCGAYDKAFAIPLTIITVLQFATAPLLGVLFIGALGIRKQSKFAIAYYFINLITEIVCAPFGLIFYFDETGYHRGSHFAIYSILFFISLVHLLVGMVLVGKKFKHRDIWTIIMVLILLISGIIPMAFYKINITYIAIAIGASVCYIYYNDLVQQDIKEDLLEKQERITNMQTHMISGLASFVENRDMDTGGHISRTSYYVKTLAMHAKNDGVYTDILSDHYINLLYLLAPMHDVGKILISDNILRKPAKLTVEEYDEMKKHAALGGTVVKEVLSGVTDEEYLNMATDIATYHHEWWDGTGYPNGLKEEEIPLCARIMAIADVFDALISERCYKEPIPANEAFKIIKEESGTHFDPKLVEVFLNHKNDFKKQ